MIKIQEGCNQACAYCIVPKVRGRERSIPPDSLIEQVNQHVAEGGQEVVLTGTQLGKEHRDRRIREAFTQLSAFSETVDRVREARSRVDYLFMQLDDVSAAVERLWELASANIGDGLAPPEIS
jgi:tRNA A37 methylthiotransferase MiaB